MNVFVSLYLNGRFDGIPCEKFEDALNALAALNKINAGASVCLDFGNEGLSIYLTAADSENKLLRVQITRNNKLIERKNGGADYSVGKILFSQSIGLYQSLCLKSDINFVGLWNWIYRMSHGCDGNVSSEEYIRRFGTKFQTAEILNEDKEALSPEEEVCLRFIKELEKLDNRTKAQEEKLQKLRSRAKIMAEQRRRYSAR